jgi:hypothetical protein
LTFSLPSLESDQRISLPLVPELGALPPVMVRPLILVVPEVLLMVTCAKHLFEEEGQISTQANAVNSRVDRRKETRLNGSSSRMQTHSSAEHTDTPLGKGQEPDFYFEGRNEEDCLSPRDQLQLMSNYPTSLLPASQDENPCRRLLYMSYFVFCTFDLNASSQDYQNAYAELGNIGPQCGSPPHRVHQRELMV